MTGIPILDNAYLHERFTPLNGWLKGRNSVAQYALNYQRKKDQTLIRNNPRRIDLFHCPDCGKVYQVWSPTQIEYLPHFPIGAGMGKPCGTCKKNI